MTSSRHAAYTLSATHANSSVHAERPQKKWDPKSIGFALFPAMMTRRAPAFSFVRGDGGGAGDRGVGVWRWLGLRLLFFRSVFPPAS